MSNIRPRSLILISLIINFFAIHAEVYRQSLDDDWQFRQGRSENWLPATVPGTVHTDLMANRLIDDPFFGMNERSVQWIDKEDWIYETTFSIDEATIVRKCQNLHFDGLDTYADVYLNDQKILEADNMFRRWDVDVKNILRAGENTLRIYFHSPIKVDMAKWDAQPIRYRATNDQSQNGGLLDRQLSVFARKAGYHYGWDWGPRLVTSGIWRGIELQSWDGHRITDLHIRQDKVDAKRADITAIAEVISDAPTSATISIIDEKSGKKLVEKKCALAKGLNTIDIPFSVKNPKLWWCNGLGDPNLYQFTAAIADGKNSDRISVSTGLRSIEVVRDEDADGTSFYFKLNGVPVFAKGANYIPSDCFLSRVSKEKYRRTLLDASEANMNMLRVWGGGVYEDDYFYHLCDSLGLMVWQDYMFACSVYPAEGKLLESIKAEAADNVRRLRNHPSIALWCGNNEINEAWYGWDWKNNYIDSNPEAAEIIERQNNALFYNVLDSITRLHSPGTFYWPSSPFSRKDGASESHRGDRHYWNVWHGQQPINQYNYERSRFFSEYGFQSFPELETVKLYAPDPSDWDISSEVMMSHQRGGSYANWLINKYLTDEYRQPSDFPAMLHVGSLLQGDAVKTAIEAHRRDMPYCMGTLFWQHNDCWPVASWATRDYYGRWKAAHYFARKAFDDILVSPIQNNDNLQVKIVSDRLKPAGGTLSFLIIDLNDGIVDEISAETTVPAQSSSLVWDKPLDSLMKGRDKYQTIIALKFTDADGKTYDNIFFAAKQKELQYANPDISTEIASAQGGFDLSLTADKFARGVMLSLDGIDNTFSDNYFDLLPGMSKTVKVTTDLSESQFRSQLKVKSLADTYSKERSHIASSSSFPTRYDQWPDAFPSGNGRQGALIFCNPNDETLIFCDRQYNFPNDKPRSFAKVPADTIERIKQLCVEGKFAEANSLAVRTSQWTDGGDGGRHPGFALNIQYLNRDSVSDYSRSIDYSTGLITTEWTMGGKRWRRSAFTSSVTDITALRLEAPIGETISCRVGLALRDGMNFPEGTKWHATANGSTLEIHVTYPDGVNGYTGKLLATAEGGKIAADGNSLIITGASSACIYATTRDSDLGSADFADLYADHTVHFTPIFNRVAIDFNAPESQRLLSNEALLEAQRNSPRLIPALHERLFDAGRYTFMSSSSALTPPDLLGIWTGDCNVGWGGFYHLDANLNLQIAAGNIGRLDEGMEGYFNLHDAWLPDFRRNASDLLGCRGLLACGNTPGLSSGLMASINDDYPYHWATGEEPWLLYPYWEHYLTTRDSAFLRARLYPRLLEMADFYQDFLKHKDSDGKWIFAGSISQENKPANLNVSLLNNSAIDVAGARFIFDCLFKSAEILGENVDPRLKDFAASIPDYSVNSEGALAEWGWAGLEDYYNHRHSSHLIGVWPYKEISRSTPHMYDAARTALDKRDLFSYGDAGHGLLMGALIAAGLNNPQSVENKLHRLSAEGFYYNSLATAHFPNRYVYCTDVVNSFPAILLEMLAWSDDNTIELLPALPASFPRGSIRGMMTRCGVELSNLAWDDQMVTCTLTSPRQSSLTLRFGNSERKINLKANQSKTINLSR